MEGPFKDPAQVRRARQQLTPRQALGEVARIQKVLCESARIGIVQALTAGPLCVDDLAAVIKRARPATSQHLRVLREAGVVEGTRRGTTVYYQLRSGSAAQQVTTVLEAIETTAQTIP